RRFVETASGEDREERAEERAEKAPDQAPQTAPEPQRPVTPEQQQELAREFADALRALGFAELENLANGQDGVENAFQLLTSEGKEKFESLAREQKISIKGQFPPRLDGELPEPALMPPPSPPAADAERPAGPAGPAGGGASPGDLPGTEAPASAQVPDHPVASGEEEDEDAIDPKKRKRRGKNILWSVLGTLRRQDEAVRQAEEKWDRVVVTALLFLLFVVLVTVALVSL
ncbi:MAG TPA: hypothetical protein VND93_06500, partial [Myxococcales bacterium]|nr:hypothetical protein [Myxococcales bacterium]